MKTEINTLFLQVVQWGLEDQEDPTKQETDRDESRYSNNRHAQTHAQAG